MYSYAKFASPFDKELAPAFDRVLNSLDELDSSSLVRVYEVLYKYRKDIEVAQKSLPPLPKPK